MAQKKTENGPSWIRVFVEVGLAWVLPYVIVYGLAGAAFVWFLAKDHPQIVPILVAVLVFVLVAALALVFYALYKFRRFQHFLLARRADKQNAAYLSGDDKRGIHGKFRPEDLH